MAVRSMGSAGSDLELSTPAGAVGWAAARAAGLATLGSRLEPDAQRLTAIAPAGLDEPAVPLAITLQGPRHRAGVAAAEEGAVH